MKLNRTRLVGLAIALAVALLLVWALLPKPVPVDLEAVDRGPLAVTVDEEGETRVRDPYVVSAPFAGKVLRITLEAGDPVIAGETVLATFQPGDPALLDARARAQAEARVRAAEATLGRARAERDRLAAEHALTESEAERMRRLAEGEIVSREQLDRAVTTERSAAEALAAAEYAATTARHELEMARAALLQAGGEASDGGAGPLTLRSPVDGVVLRRFRESEAVVAAGERLLEVADPARLEIVSDLLSTDAVRVSPGDPVRIEQWGGGETLHGTVRRVEPSGFTKVSALGVEEQRVNVIVDFGDPRAAWERLGDGYRVELAIVVWQRPDALRVPVGALFRAPDGSWAVYAAEDGEIARREIEIGHRNDLHAEVVSGLEEGDRVAVHPSDQVAEGVELVER